MKEQVRFKNDATPNETKISYDRSAAQSVLVASAVGSTDCDARREIHDAESDWLDALERFLETRGCDLLCWRDGCVVIETYYEKQFRAMGGDLNRLISYFEDYFNMDEAARKYIAGLRASNEKLSSTMTAAPTTPA